MSVKLVLSTTRNALWPNVEYSSSPGVQVRREMRRREESWALVELKIKNEKLRIKNVLRNNFFIAIDWLRIYGDIINRRDREIDTLS